MLRPLSASNTTPNFKGLTYTSDNSNDFKTDSKSWKNMSPDLKNGFYAGLIMGTALATTGTVIYKDTQIDRMLKDVAATKVYEEADSFRIADMNEDKIPEFVLIDKNGDETVYDFTTGKIYLNENGELIDKE